MSVTPFRELRPAVEDALTAGDAHQAFMLLRPVLDYPGQLEDREVWQEALTLFAQISDVLAGEEFANGVRRVVNNLDDVAALFDLGYELIEQNLPRMAATVLARANELAPGQDPIVRELAIALERDCRFAEAASFLRASGELLQSSFLCRYLLAYNALMTGDLEEPRTLLPTLLQADNADFAFLASRIQGMLLRADAVREITPLNTEDLRGWHFVITGALLLHLSPYGFHEGMHGRYAYTQDDRSRCLEGLRRLLAVLEAWEIRPPKVWLLEDDDSASLAHAAAQLLEVPLASWPAEGDSGPGLVVAYDLDTLEPEVVSSLHSHHPGQVLWAHASCWTSEPPFAPDLTTYMYQLNVSPWDERLQVDPETGTVGRKMPPRTSPEERATKMLSANLEPETLADLSTLLELAQAARSLQGEHGTSVFRTEGTRRRQGPGSPVPSNCFM